MVWKKPFFKRVSAKKPSFALLFSRNYYYNETLLPIAVISSFLRKQESRR